MLQNPIRLERQANRVSEQAWALSEARCYAEASAKHGEAAELYRQSAEAWTRLQAPLIGFLSVLIIACVALTVIGVIAS